MNVKELIVQLEKLPQGYTVSIWDRQGDIYALEEILIVCDTTKSIAVGPAVDDIMENTFSIHKYK